MARLLRYSPVHDRIAEHCSPEKIWATSHGFCMQGAFKGRAARVAAKVQEVAEPRSGRKGHACERG
eukprot:5328685-Pleurochrysis_carterae.AAC.1